jgi:hypothetical protein
MCLLFSFSGFGTFFANSKARSRAVGSFVARAFACKEAAAKKPARDVPHQRGGIRMTNGDITIALFIFPTRLKKRNLTPPPSLQFDVPNNKFPATKNNPGIRKASASPAAAP